MTEHYIVSLSLVAAIVGMMTIMMILFTHLDNKLTAVIKEADNKITASDNKITAAMKENRELIDKSMKENRDYIAMVIREIRSDKRGVS
jgi:hypothetical protein